MYIKKLGLENFRIFKEYQEFDFKKITLLVGPNNSGKSSLIKALHFLQENAKNGLENPKFGSETKHGMLSFEHAINSSSQSPYFRIKCDFDLTDYPGGWFEDDKGVVHNETAEESGSIDISFEKDLKDGAKIRSIETRFISKKAVFTASETIKSETTESDNASLVFDAFKSFFEYAPPFRSTGLKVYNKEVFEDLSDYLKRLKTYMDFDFGESVAFVKKWCSMDHGFKIGDFQILETDSSFEIELTREGKKMDLSFLGTGASQVFSIIIQIGTQGQEQALILEEPETNLHPSFQSKLAELIADGIGSPFWTQFIIETHSEYLIRKFQYMVAKGEINSEDIQIYYFSGVENENPKTLTIKKDGSLSGDFGKGFFDEAPYLITELWKAQRN